MFNVGSKLKATSRTQQGLTLIYHDQTGVAIILRGQRIQPQVPIQQSEYAIPSTVQAQPPKARRPSHPARLDS